MNSVCNYILDHWDATVREVDPNNHEKTLIPLPRPYTVPCMDSMFQEMYYWDTYFTNRGLLLSGRAELVHDNLANFIYLVDTYGFIPNGSRTGLLTRSQPAFFGMMISDYYNATGDIAFLRDAYAALCKEYKFWMTERCAPNGLNCYSAHNAEGEYAAYVKLYKDRTGIELNGDTAYWGRHVIAEAESGWDFNPRFHSHCHDYNPVDLNSLIYFTEVFLGKVERILEIGDGADWDRRASKRKDTMLALMRAEDGVFYDYDYVNSKKSEVVSCAAFFPFATGMLDDGNGMDILLEKLELAYGLQATEAVDGNFQWGQKNGWAALQLMAVEALESCGRIEDARRIAGKYVHLVEKTFEKTGAIWEKYNIVTGDNNAIGEYGTPTMMGWSAGVYLAFVQKLNGVL